MFVKHSLRMQEAVNAWEKEKALAANETVRERDAYGSGSSSDEDE